MTFSAMRRTMRFLVAMGIISLFTGMTLILLATLCGG